MKREEKNRCVCTIEVKRTFSMWVMRSEAEFIERDNENTHFLSCISEPKRPFGSRCHNYSCRNLGLSRFFAEKWLDRFLSRIECYSWYPCQTLCLREIFDFLRTRLERRSVMLVLSLESENRKKSSIDGRLRRKGNISFLRSDSHSTDKMYCVKGKREKKMYSFIVWASFLFSVERQMLKWRERF